MTSGLGRAGLVIAGGGLTAALLIVFCALPPFQTGVWYQSEPVAAALHAVAAVAALGLGAGLIARDSHAWRALLHPLVALPAALALWSAAMSPFVNVPLLSWFGTPEQAEGIAWYFDLAVLIAAARWLCRHSVWRRWLAYWALGGVALATGLTLHTESKWAWAPFLFYDYLAFYGLFGGLILYTLLRPRSRLWRAAILVFALVVIMASGNRAAIGVVLVVAPVVWLAGHVLRNDPHRARLLMAVAAAIAPLMVIGLVFGAGQAGPDSALWSRMLHLKVVQSAVIDQPARLITGHGWGGYSDHLIRHMPSESVDFRGQDNEEANWDALRGPVHFHSHNFLAEGLAAAGLIGLLLTWTFPIAVPLLARRRDIAVAGAAAASFAALYAVWFQLPGSVPYMALALAGLSRPASCRALSGHAARVLGAVTVIIAIGLAATAATGIRVGQTMLQAATDNRATNTLSEARRPDCADFLSDGGRGGIHLATLFRSYVADLVKRADAGQPIDARHAARLADYLCAYRAQMDKPHSARLPNIGLIVRSELAFLLDTEPLRPARQPMLDDWGPALRAFLEIAPGRSDIAVPYLNWLLLKEDDDGISAVASQILAHDRHDPVGLWFSGIVFLADPARTAVGFARMNQSLDAGLERYMPVDPGLRDQVRAAVGRE